MHDFSIKHGFAFKVIGFFFLALLNTCSTEEFSDPYAYPEKNASTYAETHTLSQGVIKELLIDTNISIDFAGIQFLPVNSEEAYLSLFDPTGPRWHLYDYNNGDNLKQVSFALEGPDGVGANTMSMGSFLCSPDTILIHNYWSNELFIFNGKGEKQKTIKLPVPDEAYFSAMLAQASAFNYGPYVFIPNIYQGITGDQLIPSKEIPAFLVVDMQDGSTRFLGQRSGIYDQGYHIAGTNSMVFGDYNADRHHLVYSFKQDHIVYTVDLLGNIAEHPVGSVYFENIEPLSTHFREGWEQESSGAQTVGEYIRTSPKYGRILYDPWRKVYYRFAQLPKNKEEYLANPFQIKPSVILMDAAFKKIGEVKLDPEKLYSSAKLMDAFVSEDGLMIPWKNEESEDAFELMGLELTRLPD